MKPSICSSDPAHHKYHPYSYAQNADHYQIEKDTDNQVYRIPPCINCCLRSMI